MADDKSKEIHERVGRLVVQAGEALHLDSHELAEIADLLLHHLVEVGAGRFTREQLKAWDEQCFADLRAQSGLLGRQAVWDLLKRVEAWLRDKHPELCAALERSNSFGHHPRVLRHVMRAYNSAKAEGERKRLAGSTFRGAATVLPAGDNRTDDEMGRSFGGADS